jgi:carbazole 1,9a-dioxygenase terminal dioxygenase component
MPPESTAEERASQGEIKAFLDEPSKHQRVKEGWRPYLEAKLGFRNHWYPALFGHELEDDRPKAVKLLGEPIILRRVDGRVYALEDRCAHRRVRFSAKVECYTKDTITCWYHGFTYRFTDGKLVQVLTEPGCALVGKMGIKTYPVQEAQGMVFVFIGDIESPPLQDDLPPGFLDRDLTVTGIRRDIKGNWRLASENGFDTTHIYIHRDSKVVQDTDAVLPLGFIPQDKHSMIIADGPGPKGVIDQLARNYIPVFSSAVGDVTVSAVMKPTGKMVAPEVSSWLPCVLKLQAFPTPELFVFEWYVPIEEHNHWYFQVLGKRVNSDAEAAAFRGEAHSFWAEVMWRGFNDQDVAAREALEDAYTDGEGWTRERLYRPDTCIIEWRKLASKYNRGIQKLK